jgi:hypothetical protein
VAGVVVGALCAAVPAGAGAISYVAMGDSYTSAPGVLPEEPGSLPNCGQSEFNYPHLVASALKLSITDVSCGGAQTKNFTVGQKVGEGEENPPQFNALSESTEVVSVGMGGNDGGLFGTLLQGCTELAFTHPEEKNACKNAYEKFVTETFAADKAPFETALKEIHEKAPKAKLFIVGYPDIAPKTGPCNKAEVPWKEEDIKWFKTKVEKLGNKNLKAEAKANAGIFVETFKPSEGHDFCKEPGVRWIEPVFKSLTGVAVHPNALGEEADAFRVEQAMLNAGVR